MEQQKEYYYQNTTQIEIIKKDLLNIFSIVPGENEKIIIKTKNGEYYIQAQELAEFCFFQKTPMEEIENIEEMKGSRLELFGTGKYEENIIYLIRKANLLYKEKGITIAKIQDKIDELIKEKDFNKFKTIKFFCVFPLSILEEILKKNEGKSFDEILKTSLLYENKLIYFSKKYSMFDLEIIEEREKILNEEKPGRKTELYLSQKKIENEEKEKLKNIDKEIIVFCDEYDLPMLDENGELTKFVFVDVDRIKIIKKLIVNNYLKKSEIKDNLVRDFLEISTDKLFQKIEHIHGERNIVFSHYVTIFQIVKNQINKEEFGEIVSPFFYQFLLQINQNNLIEYFTENQNHFVFLGKINKTPKRELNNKISEIIDFSLFCEEESEEKIEEFLENLNDKKMIDLFYLINFDSISQLSHEQQYGIINFLTTNKNKISQKLERAIKKSFEEKNLDQIIKIQSLISNNSYYVFDKIKTIVEEYIKQIKQTFL